MHLEELAEGISILHRLDPRLKIITFLVLTVCCVTSTSFLALFSYLLLTSGLLLLAKTPLTLLLKRLLLINFFLLLLWGSLILGDLLVFLYNKKGVFLDPETLSLGLYITLRSNTLFLATLALLATSPLSSLTHALLHLRVPSRLVLLFHLSYRYLSLLHQEYDKMRLGLMAKGFKPKTGLYTYRIYAYLLGMLVIKSLKRAEDLYLAMLARGYKGFYPILEHFKLQKKDFFFFIFTLSIIFFIYLLNFKTCLT
ncbi:cobalt ABC transporter permease [Caldimicrobium thiodismutans]|uniref:Cobalt ABC transporter permease n=1 Tax=Caldimicrobium thiodismutans TaxID=1653476 RepID=A0A0U5AXB5_9BACT|nr:energy-coupling factor transporter transmembrane component T [Caldimicrobium thiodismutans]BAU23071.1 cobalt ABC transporter permease [Caldimicrobium thiodismutans]